MDLVIVATVGWSPQLVIAPLSRRLPGRITLLLTHLEPQDEQTRRKISDTAAEIEKIASMIGIGVKATGLPWSSPGKLAYMVANSVAEALAERSQPGRVDVIAAGGPRLLAVTAALLAAAASALTQRIRGFIVSEESREEYPVPPLPPRLPQGETKLMLARRLAELGEATYRQLAEETGRDESTVKRLLAELQRNGYVDCSAKKGRRTICRPTDSLYLVTAAQILAEAVGP